MLRQAQHKSLTPSRIAEHPRRGQHHLPLFINLFLQVVDIPIHFNDQPRLVEDPVLS